MASIHKITELDVGKFLDLVTAVDEEASFLLFDKKERKRDEDLVKNYILKLNNNPYSILLVASDDEGNFVGYVAGEQSHLARLKHTLSLNIAVKRKSAYKNAGLHLMNHLMEHAKRNLIHRLEGTVITQNKPCLALAGTLHFKVEGTKKDAVKIGDTYYDAHIIAKIID